MAEGTKKPYVTAVGIVQAFTKEGVKQPAVRTGEANGQPVWNFTIKTATQSYVDVALWSEYAASAPHILEGMGVMVDGPYEQRVHNGNTYHKISAARLVVIPGVVRAEREVVNAPAVAAPVAAELNGTAPVAAPAAEVANPFQF